ncbi:hypothetical protein K435DRAFT_791222 [Dendrothele bispora CBS 962.96]|uniref:Uncharacterized protein n=1 Tax=Dendrothele bispora (strain CBS 962.96) TaxID=1314807 RepID=A0A4S8MPI2_DENBC|nr:hypothetical protein K435DRAFT_791222 [Dendrothele bispora CBS 962.96]
MPEAACEVHNHNSYLSLVKNRYLLDSPLRGIFADPIIGKNRVQPPLHTPNLYTKETWEKWIARIPSKRRGYKVLLALDFGEFVLSFNSNDHLGPINYQDYLSSKLTDDSNVFHINFLNQYMNEDGHLGHLITDLSLHASDNIPLSREAHKAVTPVYAYQGSGSQPPITWSFYQVRSHEYWTQLTKEQQEKKALTVTKETEENEIFYVSHPDFEQICSLLQKDFKPIFWFCCKLMQLTKKFIGKERKKITSWTVAVRLRGQQPGKAQKLLPTNSIIAQHFKKL